MEPGDLGTWNIQDWGEMGTQEESGMTDARTMLSLGGGMLSLRSWRDI